MQFLGLGFVPLFLSSAFPLLLTALHEQRFLLQTSALGLGLRIGLNFALVPTCGFLGPCISFVVGEITMVALWIYRLRRLGFPLEIGALLWRLAAASACLAAVLYPFKSQSLLLFVPAAAASVLIYAAIVWKLGTFTSTDLVLAKEGISFLQRFLDQRRSSAATPP
jgi:O-antigen/teichoic acid export membrane protein